MKNEKRKLGKQFISILLTAMLVAGSMYMPVAAEEWDVLQEEAGFSAEESLNLGEWRNETGYIVSEEEDETGTTAADGQFPEKNEAETEDDNLQGEGSEGDVAQTTDPVQAPEEMEAGNGFDGAEQAEEEETEPGAALVLDDPAEAMDTVENTYDLTDPENVQDSGDGAREAAVSTGGEEARDLIGNTAQEADNSADLGETKEFIEEAAQDAEIIAPSDEKDKEEVREEAVEEEEQQ